MDDQGFLNTRARLQRLSDAKIFAGWVQELNDSAIIIKLSTEVDIAPGDQFMFEIHGRSASAAFPAQLSMISGHEYLFSIPQPFKIATPTEEARVYLHGEAGIVTGDSIELGVTMVDASKRGAGVLVPSSLRRGERVTLSLDTPQGTITCEGEVRYCRPDPNAFGQYRAGILLEDMGRVDRARWAQLIGGSAAA